MSQADLDDKASLVKAMQGSYAVFGVTNYWEHIDAESEVRQGKNLADAAKVSIRAPTAAAAVQYVPMVTMS